jgi:glyoxylase-like metal-dependent hydrolase (beta-lactamase superfamily II)
MTGHESYYAFEQFRVAQGCLGYLVAVPKTGLTAVVDPQVEMVEVMLDTIFERGLRPAYIIDTHTHADHFSGAGEVKRKTVAKIVMHKEAPASNVDVRVEDGAGCGLGSSPSSSCTPRGTPRTWSR